MGNLFWQYEKFENSIKLFWDFFEIGTFDDIFEFKYHLLMGIIDMTGLNQKLGCGCRLLWVWDDFGKTLGQLWEDSGRTLLAGRTRGGLREDSGRTRGGLGEDSGRTRGGQLWERYRKQKR